jgi:hypothetical protein
MAKTIFFMTDVLKVETNVAENGYTKKEKVGKR